MKIYDESDAVFFSRILSIDESIDTFRVPFENLKGAELIVANLRKISPILEEIDQYLSETTSLVPSSRKNKYDSLLFQAELESFEDYCSKADLIVDKEFPFYFEGTIVYLIDEGAYKVSIYVLEAQERFGSEVSQKLEEIYRLLHGIRDLFEDFLDMHGISIFDHPYWKSQSNSFFDY